MIQYFPESLVQIILHSKLHMFEMGRATNQSPAHWWFLSQEVRCTGEGGMWDVKRSFHTSCSILCDATEIHWVIGIYWFTSPVSSRSRMIQCLRSKSPGHSGRHPSHRDALLALLLRAARVATGNTTQEKRHFSQAQQHHQLELENIIETTTSSIPSPESYTVLNGSLKSTKIQWSVFFCRPNPPGGGLVPPSAGRMWRTTCRVP